MAKLFPVRRGYTVFVTELGVRENPELDLHINMSGVILGTLSERDYVWSTYYKVYLVRFVHGSYFLLREHFMTERERDTTDCE